MDQTEKPEAIEQLEEIISTLCHEVGNSINSLKVTLYVLRENYDRFDDVKKKDYIKRASDLVDRQHNLIQAMKSYSNSNIEKQEKIAFLDFWDYFLNLASNKVKKENINLIHNIEIGPCLIQGNNEAINYVTTTLLDNAVEALDGTKKPTLELKAIRDNNSIIISIKDNGCGIKKRDMRKIFIPLFTTKSGQMGMRLPITRKLLYNMGGGIEIESVHDRGTEARIWLKTVGD